MILSAFGQDAVIAESLPSAGLVRRPHMPRTARQIAHFRNRPQRPALEALPVPTWMLGLARFDVSGPALHLLIATCSRAGGVMRRAADLVPIAGPMP